ncbi:MAG: redoxin domain-containing protein [Candidatus Marinimicrobia bacterium]|nr:redoxin domain-containing protein [Candidatus Neomarinimicrobiota bacterium]MDD9887397.1 redoxin domain-containing protein [Candidatus Neomarinimicrobiota bacterium]MDD9930576.1 redoxin domain-containing protein [Candidatus Neomarinimicrobiota bacterium]
MYQIIRIIILTLALPILAFAQTKVDTISYDQVAVSVGDMAPNFSAEDESGTIRKLSELRGEKNLILIFYRGYW